MAKGISKVASYPWSKEIGSETITFRLMSREDRERMLSFARSLPKDDLLFLAVDITKGEIIDDWIDRVEKKLIRTILVESGDRLLGHGSLLHEEQVWTRHLGGIILLLAPEARGMGIGQMLATELFAYANEIGLQKLVVRMATEQKGAIHVFEKLGFKMEALLADCVIDRNDITHDLIIMSHDITGFNE